MNTLTQQLNIAEQLEEISYYVGNTPLKSFDYLHSNPKVHLSAKLEWHQLGGSVKARPAFNIIEKAIRFGSLSENRTLIDASSGNTAIAYAVFMAMLDLKLTICIPENASKERIDLLEALHVNLIFTDPLEGTDGAQIVARKLAESAPDKYFYADQYSNNHNWMAHYNSTAHEIYNQTNGEITHFIAGLGTTGTFTGTGLKLRELNDRIKLIALQPDSALHGLEGWKHLETVNTPSIYHDELADEIIEVSTEEAHRIIKRVYEHEGLALSPSSGANLAGAIRLAEKIEKGTVVTILPDNSDRYRSEFKNYIA